MSKFLFPSVIVAIILMQILILCIVLHINVSIDSRQNTSDLTPIISISNGPIQGKFVEYQNVKVAHFLGIPYAKPPVGPLRLQLAEKPDNWSDVKSVVNYGPSCPQRSTNIMPDQTDEDCLFLNVYATESTINSSSTRLRSVLFWIHGGALTMGSGDEFYEGIPIVPLHDVVLVTHNYRLNALGFMHFGDKESRIPPNIGLKDQLLALQWVNENIAKFGGDPNQVTLFGESAGSMSVSAHILSPLSKGLFKRAILESGTIMNAKDDQSFFIQNALTVLNRTSCASTDDILGCLQKLPVTEIINSQSDGVLRFRWYFGDDFLPVSPIEAFSQGLSDDSIDILLGVEKNEFTLFMGIIDAAKFVPDINVLLDNQTAIDYLSLIFNRDVLDDYQKLYFGDYINDSNYLLTKLENAYSDYIIVCPTYMFGVKYTLLQNNTQVYGYYHTQKPYSNINTVCDNSPWMGTCHGADITYVFGHPLVRPGYPQKDIDLSLEMMSIWTHFAEFGKPPNINGTEWEPLTKNLSAMILNIDDLGKVEKERVEFCNQQWDGFVENINLEFMYRLEAA